MKYIDAEKLIAEINRLKDTLDDALCSQGNILGPDWVNGGKKMLKEVSSFINSLQQEQTNAYDAAMLEVKEYVDKLYDNASIGLNEYDSGLYNGIAETCMKLRGFIKARTSKEQSEVDYNKFEKLFDDYCERNKGHHITSRDACMWFWELGLKARKED